MRHSSRGSDSAIKFTILENLKQSSVFLMEFINRYFIVDPKIDQETASDPCRESNEIYGKRFLESPEIPECN
jgi:hypothetical protein